MEQTVLGASIIGFINIVKTQFPQVKGLYGVLIALVLGGIAGYFGVLGVANVETGVVIALASSGVYTVAKRAGGK